MISSISRTIHPVPDKQSVAELRRAKRAAAKWQRQKFLQRLKIQTEWLQFRSAVGCVLYCKILTEAQIATFLGLSLNELRRYSGSPEYDPEQPL
jgi:hypothetical protein